MAAILRYRVAASAVRSTRLFYETTIIRFLCLLALAVLCGCVNERAVRIPAAQVPNVIDLDAWRAGLPETMRADVTTLAEQFPGRHGSRPRTLDAAADWLRQRVLNLGLDVIEETYAARLPGRTLAARNIIAEIPGVEQPDQILVIGAHYDSEPQTPGADDNASAVAVALALAESFAGRPQPATIRFVFFTNEEAPFFQSEYMGSFVRASNAKSRDDDVRAMLGLEMLGYYTDEPVSEDIVDLAERLDIDVPPREDFVAIAAWPVAAALVERIAASWRGVVAGVPVVASPYVNIVGFSDHWSYWQVGYPAVMITDTSFLRNPHYHEPTDTPDTLDYARMAMVTDGLRSVVESLAADPPQITVTTDVIEITNTSNRAKPIAHQRAKAPSTEVTIAPGATVRIEAPRLTPVALGTTVVRVLQFDADGNWHYQTNGPNGRVFHIRPPSDAVIVGELAVRVVAAP